MPRKQPNRFAAFANSPKVAAWFLALVAVVCGVGAFVAYDKASSLRDHGQRVAGVVVEVHDRSRDDYVVVRFVDGDGRAVTAEVGNYRWDPKPRAGDQPELLYDPVDPSGNVADVRMGPDFFLGMGVSHRRPTRARACVADVDRPTGLGQAAPLNRGRGAVGPIGVLVGR